MASIELTRQDRAHLENTLRENEDCPNPEEIDLDSLVDEVGGVVLKRTTVRLTDKDLKQISNKVKDKLTSDNPGFVPGAVCQVRTQDIENQITTLRRMIYGLYALTGSSLIALVYVVAEKLISLS